jgi:hypothetical protein
MSLNIKPSDVCLLDLLKTGHTAATGDTLQRLEAQGFVTLAGGPQLTPAGSAVAERLLPIEADLRLLAEKGRNGSPLQTVGGSSTHVHG